MKVKGIFAVICMLICLQLNAQLMLGVGGQVDFPLMFNNKVGSYHHSLGVVGPRLSLSYIPENSTFYPSVSAYFNNLELPLVKAANGAVVNMHFFHANLTVAANARKELTKGVLHYGIGIGASILKGKDITINGNRDAVLSYSGDTLSNITQVTPVVTASLEYIFPISSQVPLYAGIAARLQYMYFFNRSATYRVSLLDAYYNYQTLNTSLYGHVVNPAGNISVYYMFGGKR